MYSCHSIRECYNLFSGFKLRYEIILLYLHLSRLTQFIIVQNIPFVHISKIHGYLHIMTWEDQSDTLFLIPTG